jgi:predicted nuclease of predicted toxin-antitoxin system
MKILLDECVPRKLKTRLTGHDCRTASEAGFAGKKNGELLRLAESDGYRALLTVDRGIEFQLNMRGRQISVLILTAKSSRFRDLVPLVPDFLETLSTLQPGEIVTLPRRR